MVEKANHKLFPLVFEFRLITMLRNGSLSGSYLWSSEVRSHAFLYIGMY